MQLSTTPIRHCKLLLLITSSEVLRAKRERSKELACKVTPLVSHLSPRHLVFQKLLHSQESLRVVPIAPVCNGGESSPWQKECRQVLQHFHLGSPELNKRKKPPTVLSHLGKSSTEIRSTTWEWVGFWCQCYGFIHRFQVWKVSLGLRMLLGGLLWPTAGSKPSWNSKRFCP